jgi:hypothetical protein
MYLCLARRVDRGSLAGRDVQNMPQNQPLQPTSGASGGDYVQRYAPLAAERQGVRPLT